MRAISRTLGVMVLLLVFNNQTQAQSSALDEYLKLAAENNTQLKALFYDYMAEVEKIDQVGVLPDPQFAFGYFINPVETRLGPQNATLGLNQAFPWFGSLGAKKDAASKRAQASYEEFENSRSNLFFEVKTAYYQYYYLNKAIDITKDNIEILKIFKNLSLVKIEAGNASLVDELRVELELNDLANQLSLFIDSRNVQKTRFNNLLNRERELEILTPEELTEVSLPYEMSQVKDSILQNNRALRVIDQKIQAFTDEQVAAKKDGLPKFNIGINYIFIGENPESVDPNNGKDALLFPSVGMTLPIYRKKYTSKIKEIELLGKAETFKREEQINILEVLFEESNKELKDSERRIQLNTEQSGIAKKVLDILITSYSTDSREFEEVLRIERQLLSYRLAQQKAIVDKNATMAFINYLLGN